MAYFCSSGYSCYFHIYTQKWNCQSIYRLYFNFLRHLHIVFHNGCTNYLCIKSGQGFPFFYVFINALFPVLLIINILTSIRFYLIVILICISLMIRDVEYLFMYHLLLEVCQFFKSIFVALISSTIFLFSISLISLVFSIVSLILQEFSNRYLGNTAYFHVLFRIMLFLENFLFFPAIDF